MPGARCIPQAQGERGVEVDPLRLLALVLADSATATVVEALKLRAVVVILADYQPPKPELHLTDRRWPLSAVPVWKDGEEAIPKMGVIPALAEAQRRGWCVLVHLDLASVLRTDPPKRCPATVSDDPGIDRPKIHARRASADEQEQAHRTNGSTPHVQRLAPASTAGPFRPGGS